VFKWIVGGSNEHDIREACEQAWPDTDAKPLIVAAIAKLREAGTVDAETVFAWCFEATREMYRQMVGIGDFSGALRAVKQLSQLADRGA